MISKNRSFVALAMTLSIGTGACSKSSDTTLPHTVTAPPQTAVTDPNAPKIDEPTKTIVGGPTAPTAPTTPGRTTAPSIEATLVLDKNVLLSTEYLYGADLQYSSYHDPGFDLYNQSLAIGHIPAKFRIVGDELQLISDNTRLFPSDVNHPEQLITRFKILSQTGDSLKVSIARSGVYLSQLFEATRKPGNGSVTIPGAQPPRDTWVRSLDYYVAEDLILQQTSIQLEDGSLAEFAESIFPRKAIAPGADFKKFEMNPAEDSLTGDLGDGSLDRYMLLKGEKNFDGEKAFTYAQHFDISNGATIDWYVTRNIPDEYVPTIAQAVEGWNRYFRTYKGIERKVVVFKGRLPEGIHLGDPRFNVINWDSRLVAGAAYESQANDPATGKQSHSLIYMPAAWVKIGLDYWKNGQSSDTKSDVVTAPKRSGLAGAARLACARSMDEAAGLLASGRAESVDQIKEFGLRLLKGTLHHEVGHALGLGHDFKGSLAFDRSNPKSLPTDSIMDYNDYEIERAVFPDLNSADGPLLEYDRQALSFIYNKSADVSDKDPVLPACNDGIADKLEGGVDPLCIRYDIEKDPTQSIVTAWNRVNSDKLEGDVSLADATRRIPSLFLTDERLAGAKDEKSFNELVAGYAAALKGPLNFYVSTGKASVNKVVRTNIKSLLQFQDGALPKELDEAAFRERVFTGVQQALSFNELPKTLDQPLADAEKAGAEALARTPYAKSLDVAKSQDTIKKAVSQVDKSFKGFAEDEAAGLPKVRSLVFSALVNPKKTIFYVNDKTDYETAVIGILADAAVSTTRTSVERVEAAKALVTFKTLPLGEESLDKAVEKVTAEARAVRTVEGREKAYAVLAALKELKEEEAE